MELIEFNAIAQDRIAEIPVLRERERVFLDRHDAAAMLAGLLGPFVHNNPLVFAMSAGGVAIATEIAEMFDLDINAAEIAEAALPWNSDTKYAAVTYDGSIHIDEELLTRVQLGRDEVNKGIKRAIERVEASLDTMPQQVLPLSGQKVLLVDDGLCSAVKVRAAMMMLKRQGAGVISLAVPTTHHKVLENLADTIHKFFCPNIRSANLFSVQDAYRRWSDVSTQMAANMLNSMPPLSKPESA